MAAASLVVTGDVTMEIPRVCADWTAKLPSGGDVEVDLGQLASFDSSCVAMMVMMRRHTMVNGYKVSFSNIPVGLHKLIDFYQLRELLELGAPAT